MTDHPASTADVLAFVTTADAGSFAGGAKRLGLSRSAVAKAVGRLETRLGTRLMTRTTRRLALTEDGRRFHARCSAALDELGAAEAEVAQKGDVPRGILRLTAPDAYGRLRIMPLVARYLALHPSMQVEVSLSDRLDGIVAEGLDLAIRLGLPNDLAPDLVARVVDRVRHGFFASPTYLTARGRPETLADLASHDAVCFRRAAQPWRWRTLSVDGLWQPLDARLRVSADSGEAVLQAAALGLGIAYLPCFLAERALASGTLEEILADVRGAALPVVAIHPSRRNLPAKVRAFPGPRHRDLKESQGPTIAAAQRHQCPDARGASIPPSALELSARFVLRSAYQDIHSSRSRFRRKHSTMLDRISRMADQRRRSLVCALRSSHSQTSNDQDGSTPAAQRNWMGSGRAGSGPS